MAGESPDAFAAAADVLASLRCAQLAAVVGCCSHGTQRLLVYELVPNGSLDMHLHGAVRGRVEGKEEGRGGEGRGGREGQKPSF